jgi:type I restriction enzyme R subunit
MDDKRISNITKYVLDHFVQKTKRNDKSYDFSRLMNVEESVTAKDRSKVEEIKEKIRLT